MRIAIGLPCAIPGISGAAITEWATRAESAGFSSLATVDRVAYPNFEPLTALTAAAVVTERIGLITSVLLAPLRTNTALLAKQAATVDQLSAGRLTLGLAVGARPDDYAVSGVEMAGRGPRLERQLSRLRELWSTASGPEPEARTGPAPWRDGGPRVILGGHAPAAIERAARCADGWIGGSGGPGAFRAGAERLTAAWPDAGRAGRPRLLALAYYALGPDAESVADRYLRDYYASAGPFVEFVIRGAAVSRAGLRAMVDAYAGAGCDELILMPCAAGLDQVGRLHDAVVPAGVA